MPGGHELRTEVYLDGSDDGPEASRSSFTEGFVTGAHFHLGAQFQILLEGKMEFPDVTLEAPAVHYTDHHVAYGPFTVRGVRHEMLVLHAKPAGVVRVDDDLSRLKDIDKSGREIMCCARDLNWEPLPGHPGARCKVLISPSRGPSARLIECPAGMELALSETPWGRFDIVYTGSVRVAGGTTLTSHGLRFVSKGENAPALKAGPEGTVLIVVEYDENSSQSYGGNNLQAIELAAQQLAKEQAKQVGPN